MENLVKNILENMTTAEKLAYIEMTDAERTDFAVCAGLDLIEKRKAMTAELQASAEKMAAFSALVSSIA